MVWCLTCVEAVLEESEERTEAMERVSLCEFEPVEGVYCASVGLGGRCVVARSLWQQSCGGVWSGGRRVCAAMGCGGRG